MEKWVVRPAGPPHIWLSARFYLFKKPIVCPCLRPLPALAAASAAGIGCAVLPARAWLVPSFSVLLFWFCLRRAQLRKRWLALLLPALFAWSAVHTALILLPAEKFALQMAGKTLVIRGKVCSLVLPSDLPGQVLIRLSNGVRVALTGMNAGLNYGQAIAASVDGFLPAGRKNPGGFDEAAWLASQGVFLKVRLQPGTALERLPGNQGFSLSLFGLEVRQAITRFCAGLLKPDENALLSGLLFGDTSRITPALRMDFKRAGLAHLMSVSGSNVSFLIFPLGCMLRKSVLGRRARLWLLLAVLAGFGFLTGWQVSVTRAILMAGADIAGRMLHRSADALSSLSLAALLMLLLQPLTALAAGFWLSLTAAASLLLFAEPLAGRISKRLPFLPPALSGALAVVICVQLTLLPLLAQISQEIALIGIAANLPAVPLAGWITLSAAVLLPLAGMASLLPAPVAHLAAAAVIRPLSFCLNLLSGLASTASRTMPGHLFASRLNPAFWLAWLLFLVLLLVSFSRPPEKIRRLCCLAGRLRLPAIIAWIILDLAAGMCRPAVAVWFLDVGQGDAILIRAKSGETLLIDGGKPGSGCQVLIPALDALGISRIDLAVVTHGHADHAGGVMELISAKRVKALAVSATAVAMAGQQQESDLTDQLLDVAGQYGIKVSELIRNDTIVLGSSIRLRVLAPEPGKPATRTEPYDENESSIIMQADLDGCRVLLAADCTRSAEENLLAGSAWQASEILKVAHHGSRMTTSAAFLAAVRPSAAIISVGPNFYGHPAAVVLGQLKQAGSQVLRTDECGAVSLVINRHQWQIGAMLPKRQ